jgi:hypothetical protein
MNRRLWFGTALASGASLFGFKAQATPIISHGNKEIGYWLEKWHEDVCDGERVIRGLAYIHLEHYVPYCKRVDGVHNEFVSCPSYIEYEKVYGKMVFTIKHKSDGSISSTEFKKTSESLVVPSTHLKLAD